jgi:D-alanyl-lipoteichoic acid acyltransferase DltB (MBOAT superfamily)
MLQNVLLLVASYFFYGFWDWRFAALLGLSTLVDFFISARLGATQVPDQGKTTPRKAWLSASILFNLSLLGFFKYFHFFADSLVGLFNLFGLQLDPATINIILPVGISFYTFQKMGYMIDVFRGRVKPERNLLSYATFVAFFPLLLAGPIERAGNLLPLINKPRRFYPEQLAVGWYLILSGYVKKVVIADNLALVANAVFDNYSAFAGLDISWVGSIYFSDLLRFFGLFRYRPWIISSDGF